MFRDQRVGAQGASARLSAKKRGVTISIYLGVVLPNYGDVVDPECLADAAITAEACEFESGWVTDHVMVPPAFAAAYGNIAEAIVCIGFLAGRTRRLELGISALIVPTRNPRIVLKQLTTLDLLSGGRVVTAVAAGWLREEFEILKAPFDERIMILDEWLGLAKTVFTEMPGLVATGGWMAPRLVRNGGPELWVGGVSRVARRFAARTGIWHPVALTPQELRPLAADFRALRPDGRIILRIGVQFARMPSRDAPTCAGRPSVLADEIGSYVVRGPKEWIIDRLTAYCDAGCDGFVVNLGAREPGLTDRIMEFSEDISPALRP